MAKHTNYPSHYIQGNPFDCEELEIVGTKHDSSCNVIQNMMTNKRYVYHIPDSQ